MRKNDLGCVPTKLWQDFGRYTGERFFMQNLGGQKYERKQHKQSKLYP